MSNGENFDFCEYVYNPLMRQYQAMVRLMQMLRDSQSNCNDVQCFNEQDQMNPMSNFNNQSSPSLTSYLPILFIWALFVLALFMFRPNSMRSKTKVENKSKNTADKFANFRNNHDDDDDNSTVS